VCHRSVIVSNSTYFRPLDFTAATILERFQNETASASLERVLKKIAQQEAWEILTFEPCWAHMFKHRLLPQLEHYGDTRGTTGLSPRSCRGQ